MITYQGFALLSWGRGVLHHATAPFHEHSLCSLSLVFGFLFLVRHLTHNTILDMAQHHAAHHWLLTGRIAKLSDGNFEF